MKTRSSFKQFVIIENLNFFSNNVHEKDNCIFEYENECSMQYNYRNTIRNYQIANPNPWGVWFVHIISELQNEYINYVRFRKNNGTDKIVSENRI